MIAGLLGDELRGKFRSQLRPFFGVFFRISRIISHFVHSSSLLAMIGISSHQTESLLCCLLYYRPTELEPVSCTIILWHHLYPSMFRFSWLVWLVQGPQVCVQSSFAHKPCSAGPSSLSSIAVDSQLCKQFQDSIHPATAMCFGGMHCVAWHSQGYFWLSSSPCFQFHPWAGLL